MSTIESIFVQIRHFRRAGSPVFGEVTQTRGPNMFEVVCSDGRTDFTELVDCGVWDVEEIEVEFVGSTIPEKIFPANSQDGWQRVRTLLGRRSRQQSGSVIIQPQTYGSSRGKTRWFRGCETHHDSMGEVVERYYHYKNAVVILPDSWFDKKLQEAYLSKRKAPEEQEDE